MLCQFSLVFCTQIASFAIHDLFSLRKELDEIIAVFETRLDSVLAKKTFVHILKIKN